MSKSVIDKPSDVFRPAKELMHKKGLKTLCWGEEETLKTGFVLSFPPPVYLIDTEYGWEHVYEEHYIDTLGDDLHVLEVGVLDPKTDEPDATESLEALEDAIKAVRNVQKGTIAIDSMTSVWDWLQTWMEQTAERRYKKTGEPMRTEWARVRTRLTNIFTRLSAKPIHFVMTAHPQEIYAGGQSTGVFKPRIHQLARHRADIVLHMKKEYIKGKGWQYVSELTKCRWKKSIGLQIQDITFDKLLKVLKTKLGVKIVRYPSKI